MKKLFLSLTLIASVGAAAFYGTGAFFSDTETSTDNLFAAGELDLTVGSTAYYAGMVCNDIGGGNYQWQDDGDPGNNTRPELLNTACQGSWATDDLSGQPFVSLSDLKPADFGSNAINLAAVTNPAWACVQFGNATSADNGLTESESEAGDFSDGLTAGELGSEIHLVAWLDNGDNQWQSGETWLIDPTDAPVSMADLASLGGAYGLFEPGGPTMEPGTDYFIGAYWCFGEIGFDGSTVSCDGSGGSNLTQTDSISGDVAFYIEQARNNDSFSCDAIDLFPDESEVLVGAALGGYDAPETSSCDWIVGSSGAATHSDIQSAIGAADDDDLICVEEGTYTEFVVNKPVTIAGLVNPETSATIVPSSASVNYLASVTASNVTITGLHFDGDGFAFSGDQLAGIHIGPGGSDVANVTVSYNLIENLSATNPNAASKGVQWHDGSSSGSPNTGFALSNLQVTNNVIRNIDSGNKGGYGFQSVGELNNAMIADNTISDIDGAWGSGVAIDSWEVDETTGVTIMRNQIISNIWSDISVQIEHKVDQTGVVVSENNLEGLAHGGSGTAATGPEVQAVNNWWGDTSPADDVFGPVDFDPYALSAFDLN